MILHSISLLLIGGVVALHCWFLALEMFLWKKPLGLRVFRMSPEKAEITAVLAANQGLYNGFLAAGLTAGVLFPDPALAFSFQVFFLSCVVIAGVYGAWSVSRNIFWIQAFPAAVALSVVFFAR
jgi:putative membrane protein